LTLGFHSNTGDLNFNMALGERRATNAYNSARRDDPQITPSLTFKHASVIWRPGDPDGETGEMRKVLILYVGHVKHVPKATALKTLRTAPEFTDG
jgi:hypothetical protein